MEKSNLLGTAVKFIRFVRPNRIEGVGFREGFFCAAYEFRESPEIDVQTASQLEPLLAWFRQNLTIPKNFNRSKSKGHYRRNTKGLSWYKEDAPAVIEKSFELVQLLNENGFAIEILRTDRVGFIVYEDEQQVVAEPFADTPS